MTENSILLAVRTTPKCDECGAGPAVVYIQHGAMDVETSYIDEEALCAACAEKRK